MLPVTLRQSLSQGTRAVCAAGRSVWEACCGLTPREREGVLLIAALFVLGLVVQGLRALLGG